MNRDVYLVLGWFLCFFATQTLFFALIPLSAAALGLPGLLIGVLVAIPSGVGVVTDVLVGVTSDTIGRRAPMGVGAFLGVLSAVLMTLAGSFASLAIGVLGFGLAMSLSLGPALARLTEASLPEEQARVQGYNGAVQGLGALTGAVVIGLVVDRLGPQGTFPIGAILMAIMLMLSVSIREPAGRRSKRLTRVRLAGGYLAALRMLATRSVLRLATLVSLVYGLVILIAGNAFLPFYVIRGLGESVALAGALLAVRNVLAMVTSPFFGVVMGRFGLLTPMLASNAVACLAVLAVSFTTDPGLLFGLVALQGLGTGFTAATANTLITSATVPEERALGFAANSLVARAGGLILPLLCGAVLEAWGIRAVFVAAGSAGCLCVLVLAVQGLKTDRGLRH